MHVPYHLGPTDAFSLSYVSTTLSDAQDALGHDDRLLSFSLDDVVYCVYSSGNRRAPQPVDDLQVTHPIVRAFVHVFRGVVDGQATIRGNKEPALENLASTLGGAVDWDAAIRETAAQLLSELITRHTLPNSNHRSSIGLTLLYLDACDISVEPTEVPQSVYNEYIRESKRILTVRRNTTLFRLLQDAGCTHIERKNSVSIRLRDYDLSVDDPHAHFYARHEAASRRFIEEIGAVVETDVSVDGVGFQSFRDQLASST